MGGHDLKGTEEKVDVNAQRADIQTTVHRMDTRVSVLETRTDQQARELKNMREDIRETRSTVGSVHNDLRKHMQDQAKDRTQLMMWVIATLVGVVVSIALPLLLRGIS